MSHVQHNFMYKCRMNVLPNYSCYKTIASMFACQQILYIVDSNIEYLAQNLYSMTSVSMYVIYEENSVFFVPGGFLRIDL